MLYLWETYRRAVECHLPYGITQCYLLPYTGERGPALTPARPAGTQFILPAQKYGSWPSGIGYIPRWFSCPLRVTHPGSNRLIVTQPVVKPFNRKSNTLLLHH